MSSAIQAPPNTGYGFGLQFNYQNWTEGTKATLVNVPWNNDYRDIVRFASQSALDAWIDGQENVVVDKMSLGKFQQNVKISTPINATMRYNYLRAENPLMPVQGDEQRNYYYFITGVNYIGPNNTELVLQLDVWQTFGYEVSFGSCYVERGHIGIANSNAFQAYGRDYLAEPEGLDVGGEYRIVHTAGETIMAPVTSENAADFYSVLVCSTVDLEKDPGEYGTDDNPKFSTAPGEYLQGMRSGASFYIFKSAGDLGAWLVQMQDRPWITQGIISVTLIPNPERYYPAFEWNDISPSGIQAFYAPPRDYPSPRGNALASSWRTNLDFIGNILGARYKGLMKFYTYPYMVIELTTWSGSPVVIKPEMWQDPHATVREMISYVPPGQRIAIMPKRYNADEETNVSDPQGDPSITQQDDAGEFLDFAAWITSFPQMPVVNNMAIELLAQQRNSLAFSFRSADWSQQRALQGNAVGYNQATSAANLGTELTNIGTQARSTETGIQTSAGGQHAVVNALGAMGQGGIGGGPAGLAGGMAAGAAGAFNTGISNDAIVRSTTNANQAANRANAAQRGNAMYMRDTNRGLADWAAQGDYANTVAGIQAKIQDIAMTQPSTSGQFGGDAFNMVNGYMGYSLRWKMPNLHALRSIGDFWLRYGYTVRQYVSIPSNFMCMEKFTYWKLTETYISQGRFPEGFRQVIRGIFEKGVTVWANPDDIGNTDWADNKTLTGISY